MKLKLIFSAALVLGLAVAQAETAGTTNSASDMTGTDAMTALFGDPVIVKGKGFEIKRSELDQVVDGARANAAAAGQRLPPGFQISILNQLITIHLLLQKATPADHAIGQTEADTQFTNLVQHFGSHEAFERQLKMVGMTEEKLRAKAVQEATAKATLKRELNIHVTDAMAQEYYSNHAAAFEEPELAHVEHILLLTIDPATRQPLSTNAIEAKRKQIEELLKRARSGESFAKLAREYSEDKATKDDGGELPPFSRNANISPEFAAAAFSLTNNQISDVVQTPYGFHIIKLLDKTPAKQYAYTDEIPQLKQTVAAICKEQIEAQEIRKLAPAYVKKLRQEDDVQILDPSLKAMEQSVLDASTNAAAGD